MTMGHLASEDRDTTAQDGHGITTHSNQDSDEVIELHDLLGIIGFALYLSWVFLILSNSMLIPEDKPGTNVAMFVVYFILGEVAASLGVWGFARHMASSAALKALVIFTVFLTPIPGLSSLLLGAHESFLSIAWFLAGFGAVFLIALWGIFLSKLDHRKAVLYPPVSMLISAVVFLVLCFIKTEAVRYAIAILPWLSVVLYLVEERRTAGGQKSMYLDRGYSTKPPDARALLRSSSAMLSNSLLLGFVFFAVSIAKSSIVAGTVCLAILLAAAFKAYDARNHQRFEVSEVIKVLAPAAAIGLLPLPYVSMWWRVLCIVIMVFVGIVTETVVWTAVCEYTRVNKIMPFANMAFGRLGSIVGLEIGYLLAYGVFGSSSLGGDLPRPYILSSIVLVIVVLQAFLFRDNYSPFTEIQNMEESLSGADPAAVRGGRWRNKCEHFASLYHLTPRQKEVLFLLAKGYSTAYIEKTLVISDHTIKAHVYNIYRKADVHTRQELIESIEEYSSPCSRHEE